MGERWLQKTVFTVFILGLLAMASGCETMGAMKAGEIEMGDFIQMAKATLPGKPPGSKAPDSPNILGMDFTGMDAWFKDNLW